MIIREGGRKRGRKSVASMIDHQGGREEAREEECGKHD